MTVNQMKINEYLRGTVYPTTKVDIVENARGNGAPEDILESLEDMRDVEYGGFSEVIEELNQTETDSEETESDDTQSAQKKQEEYETYS